MYKQLINWNVTIYAKICDVTFFRRPSQGSEYPIADGPGACVSSHKRERERERERARDIFLFVMRALRERSSSVLLSCKGWRTSMMTCSQPADKKQTEEELTI